MDVDGSDKTAIARRLARCTRVYAARLQRQIAPVGEREPALRRGFPECVQTGNGCALEASTRAGPGRRRRHARRDRIGRDLTAEDRYDLDATRGGRTRMTADLRLRA